MRQMLFLLLSLLVLNVGAFVTAAYADCTGPAGPEGKMVYNTDYKVMQYCNGTDWIAMSGISPGAGGGGTMEVCRFNGRPNGNTGPTCANSSPTWMECSLQTCNSVVDSESGVRSCEGTGYNGWAAAQLYYSIIQNACNSGTCDNDYSISYGVFICVDH